jgi:hypothetical protein
LSDEELSSRAQKRTQLRIKYPGICAYFFDLMLNIVITEVIGWDLKKQVATSERLFGIPEAFICAVEEQGRTTLHAHFEIWIKDFNEIRNQLYDSNKATQKTASIVLSESMDKVASCCLYPAKSIHQLTNRHETFPHACNTNVHLQHRQVPKPVDDQQLRNLRYKEQQGMLAYCPHCTVSWTSEQLVESFLKTIVKVPGLTEFPDGTAKRLKAMAVEYQKSGIHGRLLNSCIVDASYNFHCHTNSCFGKTCSKSDKKKRKREWKQNADFVYPNERK